MNPPHSRLLHRVWRDAALVLGTGFGLGFSPIAPGTVGSLLGPPLVWGLRQANLPAWGYWTAAALLILAGGPICGRAAKHFAVKDPGWVVYDEIVSFFLVFAFVPLATPLTPTIAVLGFLWFRVFDVAKPWPVNRLEHLPGGWGILCDDLAAALYAAAALWATLQRLPASWYAP